MVPTYQVEINNFKDIQKVLKIKHLFDDISAL